MSDTNVMNVTTGEVRLSYVNVFKPYSPTGKEEDAKYSVTCLLPKSDVETKQAIDQAIAAATQKGIAGKWNGAAPPIVPDPMWDGDGVRSTGEQFGPECKNCWVFTASSKPDRPPHVVDSKLQPIVDQSAVYSGCYGHVNFNVAPYSYGGKKGIGFYLAHVMKMRDGEVLGGGRITAAQAFGNLVRTDADGFMPAPKVDPFSGQPLPSN